MRVMVLALSLLLAGCAGADHEGAADDDAAAPAPEVAPDDVQDNGTTGPLLSVVGCDMPDRPVFSPMGPTDTMPSHCAFQDLDLPEGARSMHLEFTYTATAAQDEFGIRLADFGQCDANGGPACDIAHESGPSPVSLDVHAGDLEGFALEDLHAYANGYGVDTTFHLEISFYNSDEAPGVVG